MTKTEINTERVRVCQCFHFSFYFKILKVLSLFIHYQLFRKTKSYKEWIFLVLCPYKCGQSNLQKSTDQKVVSRELMFVDV